MNLINTRQTEKTSIPKREIHESPMSQEIEDTMTKFCNKYIVLMEALYRDKELNQWCKNYSKYTQNTEHCELERMIYDGFMKEAYALNIVSPAIIEHKPGYDYCLESALAGTKKDLIWAIAIEIRMDYGCNGSLVHRAIADGNLYRLMRAYLSPMQVPQYTI